jgi:hypothetical protein
VSSGTRGCRGVSRGACSSNGFGYRPPVHLDCRRRCERVAPMLDVCCSMPF